MEAIAEGYSEGIALDTHGQSQRRQRPEPVPRPRQHPLHAAAVAPSVLPGHHAQLGHHARAGSRVHGAARRCCRASCSTSPTRRSSSAPPSRSRRSDRSTRSRSAAAGAARSPRRIQKAFFDVINGEVPGSARLADVRVSRRAAPDRQPPAPTGHERQRSRRTPPRKLVQRSRPSRCRTYPCTSTTS